MDLKAWIKSLTPEKQDLFFRQAALFFTDSELSEIIGLVSNGYSLYSAHNKAGVLDRYTVDLNNIRMKM